jgi:glutathione S-transferase/GST-like protein
MSPAMLELYHWEPNALFLKPLIALEEKGAPFVSHWYDVLRFDQFDAGFPSGVEARLTLEREGPLMVADGTVIASTFFMLEYIAEAVPGPALMPTGAYDRYRARAWGQFLGLSLGSATLALGCARYLAPELARQDEATLKAQLARIEPIERRAAWLAVLDGSHDEAALRQRVSLPVGRLEAALARDLWLAGAEYSIADIDAFALVDPLRELAPDAVNPAATPRLLDWLARIAERPAVRAARARSRSGHPERAFVPGVEAARWG